MPEKHFETEDLTPLFIKGFNAGYYMAKHLPVLTNQLTKAMPTTTDFFEGFTSGVTELKYELSQEHLKDLNKLRSDSRETDRGKEV